MNNVRIINYKHFYKAMGDYYCGKSPFIEINPSDVELKFYDVKPSEGYEIPVNEETGEKLPNCCETHKKVFKSAQDWFNDFPNCCEPHKNLLKATWFKKEDYKEVPLKLLNQLAYTTDHIARNIDKQGWYKDITDYIEYNINSFGQLPTGYGNPVGIQIYITQLQNWIAFHKEGLLKDKFKQLNDFIESQITPIPPSNESGNSRDLNILLATYQKWLKIFPFGISYFTKIKKHFSNSLPFLAEMPVQNKYTGLAKAKLQTQAGLVEYLNNITTQLLNRINTDELLKSGVITDKIKHSIELAGANHKLKQSTLLTKFSKGELKYVKVLKTWLANEKEYFKEILPMIQTTSNSNLNDGVLIRDDYFQIILEIYNLHRDTLDTYLTNKYNKLISKNPLFVACLYKDINKVMEGVHKEGEPDLLIENGDFVIEYGDLKLTGNPSIFDDAMTWLWAKLMEGFVNNTSLSVENSKKQIETDLGKMWQSQLDKTSILIKNFENEFLKRNDYTPAYVKKIAELNKELKAAQRPEPNIESREPNTKQKLSDITITDDAYNSIISLLTDKGYCQKDTLKWIDDTKGNKGLLIAVLKEMRAKGYFKSGVNPSNEDYKNIAANTFDLVVSIDTVKKSSPKTIHIDFIPLYSAK